MPRVSVIIPFYRGIEWLSEAVRSVLGQSYSDFEIIIVDDGSSEPPISHLSIEDNRIRHVRQENKGPAAARNHGIDLANGYYIAFLDSDDLFLPTKLEKQVACMDQNPHVALSHTSYQQVNAEGVFIETIRSGKFSGMVYPTIIKGCPITTSTVMIRRGELGELRFEESLRVMEDVILWIKLAKTSIILGINETLTSYRIHGNNAMLDPQAQIVGMMHNINYSIRGNPDLPFVRRQELLSSVYLNIAHNYLRENEKLIAFRFLVRAIMTWPLNYHLYANLIKNSLLVIEDCILHNRDRYKYYIYDRSKMDKP